MDNCLVALNNKICSSDCYCWITIALTRISVTMAPKNNGQQKKAVNKPNRNGTNHMATTGGLSPSGPAPASATVKTNYEELQQNEMMVLQSIYFEDFLEQKVPNSAWKKAEPAFDIRIKARADEDIAVTLGVVLVATCTLQLFNLFEPSCSQSNLLCHVLSRASCWFVYSTCYCCCCCWRLHPPKRRKKRPTDDIVILCTTRKTLAARKRY